MASKVPRNKKGSTGSDSGRSSGLNSSGRSSGSDRGAAADSTKGSDAESLVSDADSSVGSGHPCDSSDDAPLARGSESDKGTAAEIGEESAGELDGRSSGFPRQMPNTFTAWQNEYFFLTDNPDYRFLQMRVKSCWLDDMHLGRVPTRKSLQPHMFGEPRNEAPQTKLALMAWMIFRWQGNSGRFLEKRSRLLAWGVELDNLQAALRARQHSLHPGIRELILTWAPTAFQFH